MGKEIISCEISFVPIETQNYIEDVEKVLTLISDSGLKYQTNAFSTIISGTPDTIFSLLKEISTKMCETTKFIMITKISNVCGCTIEMSDKEKYK